MNKIQIYENAQFGQIRISVTEQGEPLFCLADVCKALDLNGGARNVKSRLSAKGVVSINTPTNGGNQQMNFITEPNLYKCIFQSRKKEAEAFQDWVCTDVLPSIRKTGTYGVPKTFAEALRLAADQQEKIEKQQKQLEEQKPKVKLAEAITTNERCYPLKDLASILASKGIDIGPNRLRHFLKDNHYLGERGACYNMPRHQYIEQGLFIVTEEPYTDQFGHTHISRTVLLTGKGLEYFVNKLYKETNKR